MRKGTKAILIYAAVVVTWSTMFGGCFSSMKRGLGRATGGDTGIGIPEVLLDAVTLPVQVAVIGPLMVVELVDANTGERGAKERAARNWHKAKTEAEETLKSNFDSIFDDERFFCATNTPQREMLHDWLCWYNLSKLTTQQVVRVVARIMEAPHLLEPLAPICRREGMTAAQREWCFSESLNLATNTVECQGERDGKPLA